MIATSIDGYVFASQALYRNYSRPSRSANSSSQRASVWQDNYRLWKVPDTNRTVWLIISKRQQATPNNNVSCSTSVSQASHVYHISTESVSGSMMEWKLKFVYLNNNFHFWKRMKQQFQRYLNQWDWVNTASDTAFEIQLVYQNIFYTILVQYCGHYKWL